MNALETVAENNFDVKDDSENFTPAVNVTGKHKHMTAFNLILQFTLKLVN